MFDVSLHLVYQAVDRSKLEGLLYVGNLILSKDCCNNGNIEKQQFTLKLVVLRKNAQVNTRREFNFDKFGVSEERHRKINFPLANIKKSLEI